MRYFIKLAYNGTDFHGWQIQDNAISIQQELTEKLSTLLGEPTSITGCGRTDTGVHAKEFYTHFEIEQLPLKPETLIFKLNSMLHKNIVVQDLLRVTDDAHTRFSATKRTYKYIISRKKDAFMQNLSYRFTMDLDLAKMNAASAMLIGEKDFECFCKANTDNYTNICDVSIAEWNQHGDQLEFTISANRFLRNMVRAIVGTMLEVGRGRMTLKEFEALLQNGTRSDAGPSVPAHGLYLTAVEYPPEIFKVGT